MRINAKVQITTGTPQNLAVMLGLLPAVPTSTTNPIWVNRIDAQMAHGAVSYGLYMDLANFPTGTTASASTAGHVTQELPIAAVASPGLPFTDAPASIGVGGARDITKIWIDVSATAYVIVSVDLRN
jgi:hypothetical protein